MERPKEIYLEEPIKLLGIEIKHTEAGLHYLVDHYSQCLRVATEQQIAKPTRDHAEKLIEQYRQHIALYESARSRTDGGAETL